MFLLQLDEPELLLAGLPLAPDFGQLALVQLQAFVEQSVFGLQCLHLLRRLMLARLLVRLVFRELSDGAIRRLCEGVPVSCLQCGLVS
jgi:hypothetical protein